MVACEPHVCLDARKPRGMTLRSVEQRSMLLREDSCVEKHFDDGVDPIRGVPRGGR